jgi:hypothetical protein
MNNNSSDDAEGSNESNSNDDDSTDSSFPKDLDIKDSNEILSIGLKLLGFTDKQLSRKSKHKRRRLKKLFTSNFGAGPHVVAQMWEDMQTTTINEAYLALEERNFSHFLYTFHFIKAYPTEAQRVGKWHECDRVLRDQGWSMQLKIQALKEKKIAWPSLEEIGDNIWVGTSYISGMMGYWLLCFASMWINDNSCCNTTVHSTYLLE